MKKILLASLLFAAVSSQATAFPDVNEKILKAFKETFSYAEDVVWQERDHSYQVNFWQGEINIRARYDEQGNLLGTIRYYYEKQLPPSILSKVKSKYSGKTIFGVTEVSSEDDVAYFINLRDEKHWYVVKSDVFGNLQLNDKFKRADGE
ncbi:MAG: hypothetical protein QM764_18200 [Chitinophagaceae bacterium]